MRSTFETIFFGLTLLGVAYTTNITTTPEPTGTETADCTPLSFFRVFACLFRLADFMRNLYLLDTRKESILRDFQESCISLQECSDSIVCGKQLPENEIEIIQKMRSVCSRLRYIFGEFKPCAKKVIDATDKSQKCFKTWRLSFEKDKNGTVRTQEEICANFFGDKNCVEEAVTEICSEKEWQGLRDHFIKVTPDVKDCNFGNL